MSGEKNLGTLLRSMRPELVEQVYVFCTMPPDKLTDLKAMPKLLFYEEEGLTVVLPKIDAVKYGLDFSFPSRMITLSVHSSLDAIGFLATVTRKLADAGISVNAVSAYYHDHLFVPEDRAEEAMQILRDISR